MNYFIEGLQGSGKTTHLSLLKKKNEESVCYKEGFYNHVDLAWCSLSGKKYFDKMGEAIILIQRNTIKKRRSYETDSISRQ